MRTKYDVIYWWQGGTEQGKWREALPGKDAQATVSKIKQMGYYAVKGLRSIGPPEGPPKNQK